MVLIDRLIRKTMIIIIKQTGISPQQLRYLDHLKDPLINITLFQIT